MQIILQLSSSVLFRGVAGSDIRSTVDSATAADNRQTLNGQDGNE